MMKHSRIFITVVVIFYLHYNVSAGYPTVRPAREEPAPDSQNYIIYPDVHQQVVWGLGFEIQSDSIASGNKGLPDAKTSVPHDLVPAERKRLSEQMLSGFRYCRLAGGLYYRGLDEEGKYLLPRWPEQLEELKTLLDDAGVEGLSFEYWSCAPYWKANREYTNATGNDKNCLRIDHDSFLTDPEYLGDEKKFLSDFAEAHRKDVQTLQDAGFTISMWGLSNEPWVTTGYSSCKYTVESYTKVFQATAPLIRQQSPETKIIADTNWGAPKYIVPTMNDPEKAELVDALVIHSIGTDSKQVVKTIADCRKAVKQKLPVFQNEYEYLQGPATPARCLNTVQDIMNWFQLAQSPTWFWIHALKPFKNAEASGYSLGFWMPTDENYAQTHNVKSQPIKCLRTSDKYDYNDIPQDLLGLYCITINRGDGKLPALGYSFEIDKKARVYLAVQDRGTPLLPQCWKKIGKSLNWGTNYSDTLYVREFEKGKVEIPGHNGKDERGYFGVPNTAFVMDISGETNVLDVSGIDETLGMRLTIVEKKQDSTNQIEPGHWVWNKYNWHSLVGFLKYMPWDSTVVKVDEEKLDHDCRILAYIKPDGKMVIVLSNRCFKDYTFNIDTGLKDAVFAGFRYTPDDAGKDFMGVELEPLASDDFSPKLPDMSWEFWIQQ